MESIRSASSRTGVNRETLRLWLREAAVYTQRPDAAGPIPARIDSTVIDRVVEENRRKREGHESIHAAALRLNLRSHLLSEILVMAGLHTRRHEPSGAHVLYPREAIDAAVERLLPILSAREAARQKVKARYRDDETGACLTCQATAECSRFKKLVCRWCEEAEEASDQERDDESEDEDE